jgi:hypothetical protein
MREVETSDMMKEELRDWLFVEYNLDGSMKDFRMFDDAYAYCQANHRNAEEDFCERFPWQEGVKDEFEHLMFD